MQHIFFDNWSVLLRTTIIGVLAYGGLLLFLRISGKRTLAKMNAFDFVVTVALGSTLASLLLSKEVALAQGLLAFALLIALQFLITWFSVRTKWLRRVVTGEPSLLLYRGQLVHEALKRSRVSEEELKAAVRSAGMHSLKSIEAVVLETDGSFSVIPNRNVDESSIGEDLETALDVDSWARGRRSG